MRWKDNLELWNKILELTKNNRMPEKYNGIGRVFATEPNKKYQKVSVYHGDELITRGTMSQVARKLGTSYKIVREYSYRDKPLAKGKFKGFIFVREGKDN